MRRGTNGSWGWCSHPWKSAESSICPAPHRQHRLPRRIAGERIDKLRKRDHYSVPKSDLAQRGHRALEDYAVPSGEQQPATVQVSQLFPRFRTFDRCGTAGTDKSPSLASLKHQDAEPAHLLVSENVTVVRPVAAAVTV